MNCLLLFYSISQNRLTSLIRSYKTNGLVAKEKRSGGRRFNIRAHSFADIEHCVAFITNYVEDHALALPGRIPGCRREAVKLLPSSETKVKVYGHTSLPASKQVTTMIHLEDSMFYNEVNVIKCEVLIILTLLICIHCNQN